MNVIESILLYDAAYKVAALQADALQVFVLALSPDNSAYCIDSPFESALVALIEGENKNLWDWYLWWLYEGGGKFNLDGVEYNTGNYTLKEFLEIIEKSYSK